MGLREELRDPLTPLAGGLAGGLAWAVGIAVPPALAIGVAVVGVKLALGAASRGSRRAEPAGQVLPPVPPGSPAGLLLSRAERAARSFDVLARGISAGPLADQVSGIGEGVRDTLTQVRTLAGQAQAVDVVLYRLDPLAGGAASTARARQAADEKQGSFTRIKAQRDSLLGEVEAAAAELEELVAKVAELVTGVAASDTTGTQAQLTDLGDRLDGLRQGLAETERLTRGSLAGRLSDDPPDARPGG